MTIRCPHLACLCGIFVCHSVHGEVMTREPPTDQLWALFQSGASFGQFGVDNYLYTFVLMHSINLFILKLRKFHYFAQTLWAQVVFLSSSPK